MTIGSDTTTGSDVTTGSDMTTGSDTSTNTDTVAGAVADAIPVVISTVSRVICASEPLPSSA